MKPHIKLTLKKLATDGTTFDIIEVMTDSYPDLLEFEKLAGYNYWRAWALCEEMSEDGKFYGHFLKPSGIRKNWIF